MRPELTHPGMRFHPWTSELGLCKAFYVNAALGRGKGLQRKKLVSEGNYYYNVGTLCQEKVSFNNSIL